MALFEAGIMGKMTENEYEKLGKQKAAAGGGPEQEPTHQKQPRRSARASEDSEKLQPISLKMLQGAFYLLCIGSASSGFVLGTEILFHKHHGRYVKRKKKHFVRVRKVKKKIFSKIYAIKLAVKRFYRRVMHEAYVSTLEYLE